MTEQTVKYVIVGAPKCASTSLYDLFLEDERFAVTEIKETHFFSANDVGNSYYDDVPIVADNEAYNAQFMGDGTRVDICPSYFASDAAIAKLKVYNPEARVLILVRDPIKRMLSHYKMDIALGYTEPDTMDAIWESQAGERFDQYFGIGQYVRWIEKWRAAFGDNVFVVNLVDQPFTAGKATVEQFLEANIPQDELPVSNVAKSYNLPIPFLRKIGILKIWDNLVPTALKGFIKGFIPHKKVAPVVVSEALKTELKAFYAEDYALLESLKQ